MPWFNWCNVFFSAMPIFKRGIKNRHLSDLWMTKKFPLWTVTKEDCGWQKKNVIIPVKQTELKYEYWRYVIYTGQETNFSLLLWLITEINIFLISGMPIFTRWTKSRRISDLRMIKNSSLSVIHRKRLWMGGGGECWWRTWKKQNKVQLSEVRILCWIRN